MNEPAHNARWWNIQFQNNKEPSGVLNSPFDYENMPDPFITGTLSEQELEVMRTQIQALLEDTTHE
jgi:hypothetical protein